MTSANKSLEKKNFLRDFLLWDFTIKTRLELKLVIRWCLSFFQILLFVTSLNQLQRIVYKDCALNKTSGFHITQQLQPSRHSFCYILYLRRSPSRYGIHVQGFLSVYEMNQAKTTSFKGHQRTYRSLQTTEANHSPRRTVPTMAPVFYRLMMIVILAFLTGQCRGRNPFWFRPTPKRDQQYYQCKYRGT